jgi:hypothetical protein
MALKKLQETITNVGTTAVFPDSYIKVEKIAGGKELLEVAVGYYTTAGGIQIKEEKFFFAPLLSSVNFIKQAYLHLKTLPEFADAIDC